MRLRHQNIKKLYHFTVLFPIRSPDCIYKAPLLEFKPALPSLKSITNLTKPHMYPIRALALSSHYICTLHFETFNNGEKPEAPKSINKVIDVLRRDISHFFDLDHSLDDSIYHPNLILKISHPPNHITTSKKQYLILTSCLRWMVQMSYLHVNVSILSIKQHVDPQFKDESKIEIRWIMEGEPKVKLDFGALVDDTEFEGVFIYYVKNELVTEQWIESIHPTPSFFPAEWTKKALIGA